MRYTIKKGKHSASGLHFGVHFAVTEEIFLVKFSKECLYQPLDNENDYNKLCGWSYGLHKKNSIRICWRPFIPVGIDYRYYQPSRIEICIYVYEEWNRRISQKTLCVEPEQLYTLLLQYMPPTNTIIVNVPELGNSMSMDYEAKPFIGYRLYPFFGGNLPAPHDMTIELNRL